MKRPVFTSGVVVIVVVVVVVYAFSFISFFTHWEDAFSFLACFMFLCFIQMILIPTFNTHYK